MADPTATFAIKLKDETSGAAESAAQALEKLEKSITNDTKQIAAMQRALKNLSAATTPNLAQISALKQRIDLQRQSVAKAQSDYVALGGSFRASSSSSKGFENRIAAVIEKQKAIKPPDGVKNFTKQMEGLSSQASSMPGPLGRLVSQLGQMKTMVSGGGPIAGGIMLIVAALAALVVGVGAATRALYKYGVAQQDARRSELLRLEGLTKMRFLFQRMPGNAKEMQDAIDQVAAKTPLARDQVAKYNEQLYRMGLRGPALSKALEGVAIKASAQGDAAASAFAGWAAGAALTGRSVDKLVDKVKSRLGGIAQRQMQSLTVQTLKQKEAFDSLFGAVNIDKYLAAWKEVNDLLTQATASGRALKFMVGALLQPLVDTSTKGAPLVKRFFQGMIIGALQLTIVILIVRNWFRKTFGDKSMFSGLDVGWLMVKVGQGLLLGLAAALGAVALQLAIVGAQFAIMLAPVWLAIGAFLLLKKAFDWLVHTDFGSLIEGIKTSLLNFGSELVAHWKYIGTSIIDGLVSGLKLEPLIARMKELALGGLDTFKQVLGIESPSKAFMKVGLAIPQGVEAGVDAGAPGAQQAASDMVDVPKLGTPAAAGGALETGAPAAGRGSVSIEIGQVVVNASGDKPEQLALDFRRELERVLEGLAHELGAPVTS